MNLAISDHCFRLSPEDCFLSSCSSSSTSSKRLSLEMSEDVAPLSCSLELSPSCLLNSLILRNTIHSSSGVHSNLRSGSSFLCHLSSNWEQSRVGKSSYILLIFSSPFSNKNCRTLMSSYFFHFFGFCPKLSEFFCICFRTRMIPSCTAILCLYSCIRF